MTADDREDFLRDLAKRAEVVQVAPSDLDESEDVADHIEPTLVVVLDGHDAEQFLSLTGIRIE